MKKPSEEELVAHLFGDSPSAGEIERALAEDRELRERFQALRRTLDALDELPVPEPGSGFEARVWRRLRPALAAPRPWWRLELAGWGRAPALAAAALALVAVGFLLGRAPRGPLETAAPERSAFSAEARERLLFASIGTHLAGSERVLAQIANAPSDQPSTLTEQRDWAEALLAANRFYRRAAERSGDRDVVALLDELEPVLLEISHTERPAAQDLVAAQDRIDQQDLLFKVRVLGSRLVRESVPERRSNSTRNSS